MSESEDLYSVERYASGYRIAIGGTMTYMEAVYLKRSLDRELEKPIMLRLAEAIEKVYQECRGPQSGAALALELRGLCESIEREQGKQ